jgi:hypothetical protein
LDKIARKIDDRSIIENSKIKFDLWRWVSCRIVLEDETNNVIIVGSCPCGREIKRVIGTVVTIQCPKCKAFIQF